MAAGESRILRTSADDPDTGDAVWSDYRESDESISIGGPWNISFLDGGPELPPGEQSNEAVLWTHLKGGHKTITRRRKRPAPGWQVCGILQAESRTLA